MVRQNTTPMNYKRSNRVDNVARMTSGRAGKVMLIDYVPVLRGDAVGGQINVNARLNHMPKPLLNSVVANVQAWFIPKAAHPQFGGSLDEFQAAYRATPIKQLGQADRNAVPLYRQLVAAHTAAVADSEHYKTLGLHVPAGQLVTDDMLDAYTLVWNFRAAQHSNKIPARPYTSETGGLAINTVFARAFWPQNRFSRVVPDYEQALVSGQLELDILAGRIPLDGVEWIGDQTGSGQATNMSTSGAIGNRIRALASAVTGAGLRFTEADFEADMEGQPIFTSLQDIDKARQLQAMAKYRSSMAGLTRRDAYTNENKIIADLMSGLSMAKELYARPWLLGNKMVTFDMVERHATDAAGLEDSTTRGGINVTIPINLPVQETGGMILVTMEVLPERIYERQGDRSIVIAKSGHLPDAARDVLRTEPVDLVPNWRIDAKHGTPNGLYGYEPMNDEWNREFTALGGAFFQATAGSVDWSEARAAIWAPEIVNPAFTADHYLAPSPFPHDVFSDTEGSAVEITVRRAAVINGLTQIGDPLVENNGDFAALDPADLS